MSRRRRTCALFLSSAAVVAVTAGCGSSGTSSQPSPSTPTSPGALASTSQPASTAPASPVGSPSSSTSGSGSPGGASTSGAPQAAECTAAELKASVRPSPGGSGAGSQYNEIVLTNSGDQPCRTGGFGGVSYVGRGHGTQIGAPATRADAATAKIFVLQPGESAVQQLRETTADNYPASTCDPTPVDGLRIYPPNETHSLYVAHATTGCASTSVQLLQISPYQPGK